MMAHGMTACGAMGLVGEVLGGLLGLALLAFVGLGIVWLVRRLRSTGAGNGGWDAGTPDAVELLRREYAGGRLSREEYLQRSDDLSARSS